jgi:hypothetical protein
MIWLAKTMLEAGLYGEEPTETMVAPDIFFAELEKRVITVEQKIE